MCVQVPGLGCVPFLGFSRHVETRSGYSCGSQNEMRPQLCLISFAVGSMVVHIFVTFTM